MCAADTFFGDISGRVGKGDILGDPGHGANQPEKPRLYKPKVELEEQQVKKLIGSELLYEIIPSLLVLDSEPRDVFECVPEGASSTNKGLTAGMKNSL